MHDTSCLFKALKKKSAFSLIGQEQQKIMSLWLKCINLSSARVHTLEYSMINHQKVALSGK